VIAKRDDVNGRKAVCVVDEEEEEEGGRGVDGRVRTPFKSRLILGGRKNFTRGYTPSPPSGRSRPPRAASLVRPAPWGARAKLPLLREGPRRRKAAAARGRLR